MKFANPMDFLVIAVMGYGFVFLANRALDNFGLADFTTK